MFQQYLYSYLLVVGLEDVPLTQFQRHHRLDVRVFELADVFLLTTGISDVPNVNLGEADVRLTSVSC